MLVQSSVNVDAEVDLLARPSKGILRAVRAAIAICNPKTSPMDLNNHPDLANPDPKQQTFHVYAVKDVRF